MKKNRQNCFAFFYQKPVLGLLLIACSLVPAGFFGSKLSLKSDFKRLLPQDKPSVVSLNRIVEKVGGVGVHEIKIESPDPEATIAFVQALVPELRKLPKKYVRFIDYEIKAYKDFFASNKYLYTDLADLVEVESRLRKKIKYEKLKQNPFFFDLDGEEVTFNIDDIRGKYKSQTKEQDRYYKGYFFSSDKQMAVVYVHPSGITTGTQFSKDIVRVVDEVVQSVGPKTFHADMHVTYAGKFLSVLNQYDQLIKDMLQTLGACLFFVALIIYLYFRRVRVVFLLAFVLTIGAAWTFALAQLLIGSLNSQTAFLGSIIVGNGVNSGIFMLSRYFAERKQSQGLLEAVATAVQSTYSSTFAAAITTSVAFLALSYSEIKGMSEFGVIGGSGMILCWLAMYTALPALLMVSEKLMPMYKHAAQYPSGWAAPYHYVSALINKSYKWVIACSVILIAGLSVVALNFLPNALEYDFSNLQNKKKTSAEQAVRNKRSDSISGHRSLNPSIILLESTEQAVDICDQILALEKDLPEVEKTIDTCRSLQGFLPDEQAEKLAVLKNIRLLLQDDVVEKFYGQFQTEVDELLATKDYHVLTLENLPGPLKRKFQEKDGTLGRIVFVYARKSAKISNGKKLMQMTDTLTNITLQDGSRVSISGDYPIFSDLLRAIERDGPIVSWLSFLFVVLLVIVYFRNIKAIVFIVGSLSVAVLLMLGVQSVCQIKLNFFNYMALPVTFGIGVDYAVNLFHRYRLDGENSILQALPRIGGAITLCSLTTIIGYFSLTKGINQAMTSFGWLALIGEVCCIIAGLLILPAILHVWDRKKNTAS